MLGAEARPVIAPVWPMARRLDNWIDSDFLMLRDLNIAVTRMLYGMEVARRDRRQNVVEAW
jgi:hypothetical protein